MNPIRLRIGPSQASSRLHSVETKTAPQFNSSPVTNDSGLVGTNPSTTATTTVTPARTHSTRRVPVMVHDRAATVPPSKDAIRDMTGVVGCGGSLLPVRALQGLSLWSKRTKGGAETHVNPGEMI